MLQVQGTTISRIRIYAITGQEIANKRYQNDDSILLDLSNYKTGVYFLEVYDRNQTPTTIRFIKK